MSELQLAMVALGVAIVALVAIYNVVQERRARSRAEENLGDRPPDALFDPAPAAGRREPTLGAMPSDFVEAAEETRAAPTAPVDDLEAGVAPTAEISNRIDTVAVVLADDPVMSEQLQPLLEALMGHTTPVHVEGIVDEQWHPVETSPKRSWRELRVGLQLASRNGPVTEEEIERFNRTIADFAAAVNAVSQREAPAQAAARAHEIDAFCADVDIEVAINVVGQYGATFAIARVKSLALENGLSETASGDFVRFMADGSPGFVMRRFDAAGAKPSPTYYTGLTFALDVPRVSDAPGVLAGMTKVAELFAASLGGQIVDDNRKPLTEAGFASIRRSLEAVYQDMEAHGVPAGSPLARRLFA
jgi:ZipA-like protein with FtsZ-binding domain